MEGLAGIFLTGRVVLSVGRELLLLDTLLLDMLPVDMFVGMVTLGIIQLYVKEPRVKPATWILKKSFELLFCNTCSMKKVFLSLKIVCWMLF